MSWDNIIESYLDLRDYVPQTRGMYRGVLRRFAAYAEPGSADWRTKCVRFKPHLLDDLCLAPSSAALNICVARRFLDWCFRTGKLSENPLEGMVVRSGGFMRAKRRSLDADEVRHLLGVAVENASGKGKRDCAIITLMVYTGLRAQSVSWMDVEDLRPEGADVVARYRSKGRSGKDKEITIPSPALQAIARYHSAVAAPDEGPLFRSATTFERMSIRSVRRAVTRVLHEADLHAQDVTVHSLRHTFASHALAAGATLRQVQEALGHENVATTERYVHSLDKARKDAAERRVDFS